MYNIEKLYERQEEINNLNQKLKGERKTHFEHYYLKKTFLQLDLSLMSLW